MSKEGTKERFPHFEGWTSTLNLSQNGTVGEDLLTRAVLRLNGTVLGLALGIVFGLVIFVATYWLVIKGGAEVGPHLSLLGQYFVGYSVSFWGGLVGAVYGFAVGFISGWTIAYVYNGVVTLKRRQ
jgi:hypothetical protein